MSSLDAADLLTVRYAANLPFLLASSPRLSSQLAQTRPAPPSASGTSANGPNPHTRCTACGAVTIGGVSGSYWVENGQLVGDCTGCHRSTVRREQGQSSNTANTTENEGKAGFGRVKKRRRIATTLERRRQVDDEILHPTALLAKRRTAGESSQPAFKSSSRSASGTPAPSASSSRADTATASGATSRLESTSATSSAKRTKPNSASVRSSASSPAPVASARPSPLPRSEPPSRESSTRRDTPLAPSSRTTSSCSESPAVSTASPRVTASPRPPSGSESSTSSVTTAVAAAVNKKRKRPKQPSGLAGLLAQKKERELASTTAAKGAGGLMDFLQEL